MPPLAAALRSNCWKARRCPESRRLTRRHNPMRKKIIAANWKMNMTVSEAESYLDTFLLEIGDEQRVDIVIVPPFTAIPKVSERLNNEQTVKLGAQNMSAEK